MDINLCGAHNTWNKDHGINLMSQIRRSKTLKSCQLLCKCISSQRLWWSWQNWCKNRLGFLIKMKWSSEKLEWVDWVNYKFRLYKSKSKEEIYVIERSVITEMFNTLLTPDTTWPNYELIVMSSWIYLFIHGSSFIAYKAA